MLGTEGTGPIDLFLSGRLAMATLNNDHMITARNAGIRFGAAPEPHNPEHERFVNAWSQTTSIWEGSDHPAEAWELLKFFGGETGQRFLMENSNLFPSIPGLREDFVAVHTNKRGRGTGNWGGLRRAAIANDCRVGFSPPLLARRCPPRR